MKEHIYHVANSKDWIAAKDATAYQPASFGQTGFVHACLEDQLAGVLERYFAGVKDLVLLEIDERRLEGEVKYEPDAGGELFPHIYGTVNKSAIERFTKIR
jgi:uncharacterized protein (DUF952 family)